MITQRETEEKAAATNQKKEKRGRTTKGLQGKGEHVSPFFCLRVTTHYLYESPEAYSVRGSSSIRNITRTSKK